MLNTTAVGLEGLGPDDVEVSSTHPDMFRSCLALIRRWLENRRGSSSGDGSSPPVGSAASSADRVRIIVNGVITPAEAEELVAAPGYVLVQTEQWEHFSQPHMAPVYRAARAVWCMDVIDYMYMVRTLGIPEARVAIVPVLLGVQ
jgi:hypothetical protein